MGHNHTAFAPEDVDDARRGAPESNLGSWAAERGLAYRGSEMAGAFVTVLPIWPEYLFNVCKGSIGGRFGQVAHELEELPATNGEIDSGGAFFGTRVTTHHGLRSLIGLEKERPNEPFAANAAWAPVTQVALRVPEVTLMPRVAIRTASHLPLLGNPELAAMGLPGYRMAGSQWVNEELRSLVITAARPLAEIRAPWVKLVVDHGLLGLARNGFVADPAVLDQMVACATAIADGLAGTIAFDPSAALPWCQPQEHEAEAFARAADELGMAQDDPLALHRNHRHLPFPGRALGALKGTLPGTGAEGRIVFAVQGGRTSGTYRTVVLADAVPNATTPLGGIHHEPTGHYAEVADRIAASWPRVRSVGRLDVVERTQAAIATFRDLGLAAV